MADATNQPSEQYQALLDSVLEATPTEVLFCGKKTKIGWLRRGTQRKFTHIVVTEKDEWKRDVKLCACVLVNDVFVWFKPLCYALLWRWYWYVKELDEVEVLRVLDASKKKIQYYASLLNTTLSTEMKDVMMTMTKREARAIQAGRAGAPDSR